MMFPRLTPLAAALLLPLPALATTDPLSLASITVKGQAMVDITDQAYSVTRLHADEIREAHADQVQSLLRKVPGMNVSTLGLPGVADNISLRGFGAGGHGGDIGFVVDGIPLNEARSHPDG